MSLRVRLIAGLLLLTAVGLVALGAITYAEQRSFLFDRVDDQTRSATFAGRGALQQKGLVGDRDNAFGGQPPSGFGGGRGGPGGPASSLPSGTYAQARSSSGTVLGGAFVGPYGTSALTAPKLPAKLPAGRLVTVSSGGTRYRVLAAPDRDEGTIVVAVPLSEADQTLDRLLLVEGIVVGGVLLLVGALAWVLVRVGLRPLDRIAGTADAIASGELDRRVDVEDARTEVGRLGLAFNNMLARLQKAFGEREDSEQRLRQFLADASHELRTPLSSIRGYAELYRLGVARSEADVEKAMGRIEGEAERMGVLVEDLLALARLDELREEVREPVDFAELAVDATDDARATAADRAITLDAPDPVIVGADPAQLRQVLGNLLRNALVHTPDGTPIEVSVRAGAGDATLVVRDHGPGLPTEDGDALFRRFWRAERGRERGRAGAGLGLAIVAGIVHAHHGEVHAENAPGGGAQFVVRLPLLELGPAEDDAAPAHARSL